MNTIDNSVEVEQGYRDTCSKCGGDGRWKGFGDCTGDMRCTMCNGAGFKLFKTPADERAKAREAAARAKAKKEAELLARAEQWFKDHPVEAEWMKESAASFEFAQSMVDAVHAYGDLTERQMETVQRLAQKSAERKQQWAKERAEREAAAPEVTSERLEQSFRNAKAKGLKWPRITMGEMVIKPAGDNSKNPGALYVTEYGAYLGKVANGRFMKVRECGTEQEQKVVALINDPVGAAEAYGHLTGHCCICNRELTNPESVARGIGPICADKFGW